MHLVILFGTILAIGLFFILADVLHLPRFSTERAMLNAMHSEKGNVKSLEVHLMRIAVRLSRNLPIDEYKRQRMEKVLAAAGIATTPEVYQAYAIVKAGAILTSVIPCLFLFPLLSPLPIFLAILVYFKETKRAEEALRIKREQVECDLPRFVATIEQELKASRDVLSMLESFKRHAGEAFAAELDILTADMRSSSYETALTRFEARLNSTMLSDIVRGLIGVLRGDDGAVYFQMLGHDLKQLELQRLKAEALKIPPKIRVFSFAMLMCFMMTYLVIISYEIVKSLGGMF